MITLFPDQEEWIAGLRDSFRRGNSSPLGVLPTGGGKTASAMLCHVKPKPKPVNQFVINGRGYWSHGMVGRGS